MTTGAFTLTNGSQTLHLSVLPTRRQSASDEGERPADRRHAESLPVSYPDPPVQHVAVSQYYESALTAIGKKYTYWDEAKLGPPTLDDLKQASAVVVFTGAN